MNKYVKIQQMPTRLSSLFIPKLRLRLSKKVNIEINGGIVLLSTEENVRDVDGCMLEKKLCVSRGKNEAATC